MQQLMDPTTEAIQQEHQIASCGGGGFITAVRDMAQSRGIGLSQFRNRYLAFSTI